MTKPPAPPTPAPTPTPAQPPPTPTPTPATPATPAQPTPATPLPLEDQQEFEEIPSEPTPPPTPPPEPTPADLRDAIADVNSTTAGAQLYARGMDFASSMVAKIKESLRTAGSRARSVIVPSIGKYQCN